MTSSSSSDELTETANEAAMARLAELLAAGREQRFSPMMLTDEEIAVLSGADQVSLAPMPWFDDLPTHRREFAQAVALRSLCARGVVFPTRIDPVTGDSDLAVSDTALALLASRRAASAFVLAERRSDSVSWMKTVYLQGEFGLVEEDVSPGGVHTFYCGTVSSLALALAAYINPLAIDAQRDESQDRSVDLTKVAAGEESVEPMADARLVTVIRIVTEKVSSDEEVPTLTAFTYADRIEVVLPDPGQPVMQIRSLSNEGLVEHCQDFLTNLDA